MAIIRLCKLSWLPVRGWIHQRGVREQCEKSTDCVPPRCVTPADAGDRGATRTVPLPGCETLSLWLSGCRPLGRDRSAQRRYNVRPLTQPESVLPVRHTIAEYCGDVAQCYLPAQVMLVTGDPLYMADRGSRDAASTFDSAHSTLIQARGAPSNGTSAACPVLLQWVGEDLPT